LCQLVRLRFGHIFRSITKGRHFRQYAAPRQTSLSIDCSTDKA
jgi:hypothetical protein